VTLPVRLHPEAQQEFDDARTWFRRNRPKGYVTRFASRVLETFRRIAAHPKAGRVVRGAVRHVVMSGFPYVIHYVPYDDHILIVSVFHTSRDPADWQGRVP
jgi:toxin ParE1/3/4